MLRSYHVACSCLPKLYRRKGSTRMEQRDAEKIYIFLWIPSPSIGVETAVLPTFGWTYSRDHLTLDIA
jgi:hypothetical protein